MARAVIRASEGRYHRDVASITMDKESGAIQLKALAGDDPVEFEPTETEQQAITLDVGKFDWPVLAPLHRIVNPSPAVREANPEDIFEFRDEKGGLVMLQAQKEDQNGKSYLPFTYWSDHQWRSVEPDGLLPLWGLDQLALHSVAFLHEGAKAARSMLRMIKAKTPTEKPRLAQHPWGIELSYAAHLGWIGGALSPHRTDWAALKRSGVTRVVVVADADVQGQTAVPLISKLLCPYGIIVEVIRFDARFPVGFDLADPFPATMFATSASGQSSYMGPTYKDCLQPATWATQIVPVPAAKGQPASKSIRIRPEFAQGWWIVANEGRPLFVGAHDRSRLYAEEGFNTLSRVFSDVDRTSTYFKHQAFASQVSGIAYEPGDQQGSIIVDGVRCVNMWVAPHIRPKPGDPQPLLDFFVHLFPDDKDRMAVMLWCATLIARPRVRMKYGLLMASVAQGVGKTTFCEIMRIMVGERNCSAPSVKDVVESQFNSWIVRKRMVFVNEIYEGSSSKAYQKLKSFITDQTLEANEKMIKTYSIKNWAHFILCSNAEVPLWVAESDRRFLVPKVTEQKKPQAYWETLYQWLASGGYSIIAQWADDYVQKHGGVKASDEAPITSRKLEMIEDSRSAEERAALDLAATVLAQYAVDGSRAMLVINEVVDWLTTTFRLKYALKPMLVRRWFRQAGLSISSSRLKIEGRATFVAATFPLDGKGWPEISSHHVRPGSADSL
ncbi:hypothetical protein EAH87_17875 [Sphingomonas koreensis]|nr:hypothetical protein EAH87_17875 [Sphingomonas koreensis]